MWIRPCVSVRVRLSATLCVCVRVSLCSSVCRSVFGVLLPDTAWTSTVPLKRARPGEEPSPGLDRMPGEVTRLNRKWSGTDQAYSSNDKNQWDMQVRYWSGYAAWTDNASGTRREGLIGSLILHVQLIKCWQFSFGHHCCLNALQPSDHTHTV